MDTQHAITRRIELTLPDAGGTGAGALVLSGDDGGGLARVRIVGSLGTLVLDADALEELASQAYRLATMIRVAQRKLSAAEPERTWTSDAD